MELYQIRYLEAAIRHSGVGRAAEELHVSQPAVTRAIKRLEDELGIQLINSNSRGIEATEYGQIFYTYARTILSSVRDVTDELLTIKTSGSDFVSIGVTPMVNRALFSRLLKGAFNTNEHRSITVTENTLKRHIVALRAGHLDLVVGMIQPEFLTGDITYEVTGKTRIAPYARASHPVFSSRRSITLEDLRAYPFAIYRPEMITDVFRNWLHETKVRSLRIGLKSNSPDVLTTALLSTNLITILPEHFAEQAFQPGQVRRVETDSLSMEFDVGILQLRGSRASRAKTLICEQLRALMASRP
jgi:DNA-binding transcriptional LysR family regulator